MHRSLLAVLVLVIGCDTGTHDGTEKGGYGPLSSRTRTAGTIPAPAAPSSTSTTAPGSTPAGAPASRLALNDKGVTVGLRLLRGQMTAAEAVTAWAAEGVTPAQAQDVLARLPLTQAFGPGKNQATIVDAWNRSTDITVIVPTTPPPAAGYPVVVFLHGLGGNSGHVSGSAQYYPDAIAVAPTALQPPAGVPFEDDAPIPLQSQFPHWWVYRDHGFAMRALDWVRERYAIDTNRIIIYGASMGGFGTWNLGLRYHDRFAGLITAAGGISRKEFGTGKDAVTRGLLENAAMIPAFFAHGDADNVVPVTFSRWCRDDLTALNIPHIYREVAGAGHDSAAFAAHPTLPAELAAWIKARVRNPAPRTVTHRAIGDYHLGAYWVEMGGSGGTVQASVSGSTITVTSTAPSVRVYIDPRLVDPTKPVTVTFNGATLFSGVPTASLEAVTRSFLRSRDPQLTYAHMVP